MRVSELRHNIEIQEKTTTTDEAGGFSEVWTAKYSLRAAIWPVSAKEFRENMRLQTDCTHNIRIRYRSGITTKMRILFGSRIFDIKGILNIEERNNWLDITCNE
jgi:SPP1 family predicted phage head-tail adaptor